MQLFIVISISVLAFPTYAIADQEKQEQVSPSVNYLFNNAFNNAVLSLYKIKNEKLELKDDLKLALQRQAYFLCYAYWYSINIEQKPIADKKSEFSIATLLSALKEYNFDIRKDLSLVRTGKSKPFTEIELKALHHLIDFPCSLSDFVSDKKYDQNADDFCNWAEQLTQKK